MKKSSTLTTKKHQNEEKWSRSCIIRHPPVGGPANITINTRFSLHTCIEDQRAPKGIYYLFCFCFREHVTLGLRILRHNKQWQMDPHRENGFLQWIRKHLLKYSQVKEFRWDRDPEQKLDSFIDIINQTERSFWLSWR